MDLWTAIQGITPLELFTTAFVVLLTYVSGASKQWDMTTKSLSSSRRPYIVSTSVHWLSFRVPFWQRSRYGHLIIIRGREIVIYGCGNVIKSMVAVLEILEVLNAQNFGFANTIQGSTFRYRPDGLMINSPTGHHSIYNPKANVTKGTSYKVWPRKANEMNTWNCTDNAKHANKRRVLNYVFSENAVRSAETYVINHVNRWCELLGENTESEWSEPRDMTQWANHLVFDILGDLCFGKSMETKEPGENELKAVPYFIATSVSLFYHVSHTPLSVHPSS